MNKIYHLAPLYKAFIWGGNRLIEKYNIKTDLPNVGMIYHVIALPGELDNPVLETGEPLSVFYSKHAEMFQCKEEIFPVRMATSCGEGKMSYHLHPDDTYAMAHEGCRGKVSGSISMEPKGKVSLKQIGNRAKSKSEFLRLVNDGCMDDLLEVVAVKDDEFLHTPAGVIHGGGGSGTMAMTFSTNSDITYRFYDYGRNDVERPLHIQQVLDCVNIPEVPLSPIRPAITNNNGIKIYHYYDAPGEYTAERLDVYAQGAYERGEFYFLFCAEGEGCIGGETITAGQTVFIPAGYGQLELNGVMTLYLVSYRDKG